MPKKVKYRKLVRSFAIPIELSDRLDRYAKKEKKTFSTVLCEALEQFFSSGEK